MRDEVWRTYQINCPEPREKSKALCAACGLPAVHHHIRFELVKYDKANDVWFLHPVEAKGFNPAVSANTRSSVIPVPGKEFAKFTVIA